MAITQAVTQQFKQDILNGVHQPSDVYKIALYTSAATLDKTTAAYTATNEVANGLGYTTLGATLSGFSVTLSGDTAVLDWTVDPIWATATFSSDGALVYNSTRANKSLFTIAFGSTKTGGGGTFTLVFPTQDASNGLLRLV
jgi:hypothetical protein